MADANVILRIGSGLGPGGLASLQAGWQMLVRLGSTVKDTIAELDKFKVVLNQVDMGMVNYADSAAKGQVDTFALMQGLQRLNKAGAQVTEEQFKTLTVQAVNLAKATGQDATAAFERLTTGIAKGSSRALTEYGIRLKESTDLQEVQKNAIDALTKGYEDLDVELQTNTERMYALGNAWGTAKGLMWDALTKDGSFLGDVIETVTDSINEMNESLTMFNEETTQYLFSMEYHMNNLKLLIGDLLDLIAKLPGVSSAIDWAARAGGVEPRSFREQFAAEIQTELEARDIFGAAAPVEPTGPAAGMGAETRGRRRGGGGVRKGPEFEGVEFLPEITTRPEFISIEERPEFEGAELSAIGEKQERLRLVTDEYEIQQRIAALHEEEAYGMKVSKIDRQARLELLLNEEYQQERLAEMREEDTIARAERDIFREFEREQALDFAQTFQDTWLAAMDGIAAGTLAATGAFNILKGTWATIVTAAIEGHNSIGQAIAQTIKAVGIQIAIDAGLHALLAAGKAIYYAATKDYAAAAKAGIAAAELTAVAVVAGVAAASASAFGHDAKKIKQTPIPRSVSSGGGATPSYGGGYAGYQQEQQEQRVVIVLDDSAAFHGFMLKGNQQARREGSPAFTEDAA